MVVQALLAVAVACAARQAFAHPPTLPPSHPRVQRLLETTRVGPDGRYCVGFSPYVSGYAPGGAGREPDIEKVALLLDTLLVTKVAPLSTLVKCVFTYGSRGAAGLVPFLAQARGLPVILNLWLEPEGNTAEIDSGIYLAKQFPDTVVGISCGSEVRLRWYAGVANREVAECIRRVRAAGVVQPVGSQATWVEWCDEAFLNEPSFGHPPCRRWEPIASLVDVLFVTSYAFWENRAPTARFPCILPHTSAAFHVETLRNVASTYPDKLVILSEFGWPGGDGGVETLDELSERKCRDVGGSRVGAVHQDTVARTTLCRCAQEGLSCILFSSHKEPWKLAVEGGAASHWGFCDADPPYRCSLPAPSGC